MTAIDWTKPVQTKNGWSPRIISREGPPDYPYVGVVTTMTKVHLFAWNGEGQILPEGSLSEWDLINVPEKHELWVNVWRDKADNLFTVVDFDQAGSDRDASADGMYKLVARIRREFEEGEGLS